MGDMNESVADQVKRWLGATQALLRALEEPDPDPQAIERLLVESEDMYHAVRRRVEEQSAEGAFRVSEIPDAHALLILQTQCAERARQVRELAAAKLGEVRAGRDAARGYRRAMGGNVAPGPGFYDRRV